MVQSSRPRRRVSRSLFAWLGYWLVLFVLNHRPLRRIPYLAHGSDKVAHFVMYLVLALLGGRYLRSTGRRLTWRLLSLWALVYIAFAAIDEWLQQFVGRTTSVGDWQADVLGVCIGTLWLAMRKPSATVSEPADVLPRSPDCN